MAREGPAQPPPTQVTLIFTNLEQNKTSSKWRIYFPKFSIQELTTVQEPPPTQKLMLGDWIAQWDETYSAWFFYNIKSGSNLTSFSWTIREAF